MLEGPSLEMEDTKNGEELDYGDEGEDLDTNPQGLENNKAELDSGNNDESKREEGELEDTSIGQKISKKEDDQEDDTEYREYDCK